MLVETDRPNDQNLTFSSLEDYHAKTHLTYLYIHYKSHAITCARKECTIFMRLCMFIYDRFQNVTFQRITLHIIFPLLKNTFMRNLGK